MFFFRQMFSMWVHPSEEQRTGASMAFNSIYVLFREEDDLVEMYTIEIFVKVMLSLSMNKENECAETNHCLEHLLRILKQKEKQCFVNRDDHCRKIPLEFPSNSTATLNDLVNWLIGWILNSDSVEARHKAQEFIPRLITNVKEMVKKSNRFDEILNTIKSTQWRENSKENLDQGITIIEVARWLVDLEIVPYERINLKSIEDGIQNLVNEVCFVYFVKLFSRIFLSHCAHFVYI